MFTPVSDLNSSTPRVRRGADAGGAVAQLAGIRLGVGDELGDVAGGNRRMHRQHVGRDADQADVRHVGDRVVAKLLVERGADAVRADIAQHQRVPVGRRLRDQLRCDRAAGAGLVLDDDLLVPDRRQARDGDARVWSTPPPGTKPTRSPRRLGRILREAGCRERNCGEQRECAHRPPPWPEAYYAPLPCGRVAVLPLPQMSGMPDMLADGRRSAITAIHLRNVFMVGTMPVAPRRNQYRK
jgi:hypothetical protein